MKHFLNIVVFLSLFCAYANSHASESSNLDKDEYKLLKQEEIFSNPIFWRSDIVILKNFLDFLATPRDLVNVKVGLKGKDLPKDSLLLFETLKKESKFGVRQINDDWLFLEEFLVKERQQVSEIKCIEKIPKEKPKFFIKLLLKSIPRPYQNNENDLHSFYQKTFQIDKLIASFAIPENPRQRLAKIIVELIMWAQVEYQVQNQAWKLVDAQIKKQISALVRDQTRDEVWDQVEVQVGKQIKDQVEGQAYRYDEDRAIAQAVAKFKAQVKAQVEAQVETQVETQLTEDLQSFQFSLAYQERNLNEVLKPVIDYIFMVYQLGTLAMRHSEALKNIQSDFYDFILDKITEDQALTILSNIDLPDAPEGSDLIETQLKILKRLIQNKS